VPGATYGDDIPLTQIRKLHLSCGSDEYFVGVDTGSFFINLGCATRQSRDALAGTLTQASGAPVYT
jgi:hypothetical protein